MEKMDGAILERMTTLMAKQCKKHKDLITYLGLTKGTYSNWMRGKSSSFLSYLEAIARYLNVSVEFLVTGKDEYKDSDLTPEDLGILYKYHSLAPDFQIITLASLDVGVVETAAMKEKETNRGSEM